MRDSAYFVKVVWDADAAVWYVSETDVPGLVCEAESPSEMFELLQELVPELVERNGGDGASEIPYNLTIDNLKAPLARAS